MAYLSIHEARNLIHVTAENCSISITNLQLKLIPM